jgi:hypothetical protein
VIQVTLAIAGPGSGWVRANHAARFRIPSRVGPRSANRELLPATMLPDVPTMFVALFCACALFGGSFSPPRPFVVDRLEA